MQPLALLNQAHWKEQLTNFVFLNDLQGNMNLVGRDGLVIEDNPRGKNELWKL